MTEYVPGPVTEGGLGNSPPIVSAKVDFSTVPFVVTVNDKVLLAPGLSVPKSNVAGETLMYPASHVPLTLTVLVVAPPPLIVMVADCDPTAVGL